MFGDRVARHYRLSHWHRSIHSKLAGHRQGCWWTPSSATSFSAATAASFNRVFESDTFSARKFPRRFHHTASDAEHSSALKASGGCHACVTRLSINAATDASLPPLNPGAARWQSNLDSSSERVATTRSMEPTIAKYFSGSAGTTPFSPAAETTLPSAGQRSDFRRQGQRSPVRRTRQRRSRRRGGQGSPL